ncbi:hypothetical protein [Streptomyces spiralis]
MQTADGSRLMADGGRLTGRDSPNCGLSVSALGNIPVDVPTVPVHRQLAAITIPIRISYLTI